MTQSVGGVAEGLRLFFAVPLPEHLQEPVLEVQRRMACASAKVKWVEPHNLHFTLKFLGQTPARVVPRLEEVAQEVARHHEPFRLVIGGAGAFPRLSTPRAIWLDCRSGAQMLAALATDLDDALAAAGLAARERRPFQAHLTIGRSKAPARNDELAEAIRAEAGTGIGEMSVGAFVLMRSQLRPSGPLYTELGRFELSTQPG